MQLKHIHTITLSPVSPFNFDATFHKPDHFTTGDSLWEPGVRWQTWRWGKVPLGIKFKNLWTVDNPKIAISIYASKELTIKALKTLIDEIKYRYNLELDLNPFYQLFANDPVLKPIISKWRGMRPGHPSSLYEYLIIGITLQNATVKRSAEMFRTLIEQFGDKLEFDGKVLWCFWCPGKLNSVSENDLRLLKVGYRAKSIKKIDDQFRAGLIDEINLRTLSLAEQQKQLLHLFGVGPATVWYILFDVFHHWDFFNHISPWEQKIYSKIFFDRDPHDPLPVDQLLSHFNKYGIYKQLAVHYVWEDTWWKRKHGNTPWLEELIRK